MAGILSRRRGWIVLAAALIFLLHCTLYLRFTVDDSFISYRFARNWAHGFGPVYNAGERVEGYTCFGWVALLAMAHRLGVDIESASKAMGVASGVVSILAVAAICRRLLDGRPAYLIAPFVLALSPLYAAWACSGMEATLFSAVIACATLGLILDESRRFAIPLAALGFGLSAIVRPEGVLFGAVAFAAVLAARDKVSVQFRGNNTPQVLSRSGLATVSKHVSRAPPFDTAHRPGLLRADGVRDSRRTEQSRDKRLGRGAATRWVLTFCAAAAPYWLWRFAYYGSLVPNTFYAKTGRGLERLLSGGWCAVNFAEYQGLAFIALCMAGLWSPCGRSAAWRFVRKAVPVFVAYVVWVGGDYLHIRFFVHVMGLLAVCAAVGFDRIAAGLACFDTTAILSSGSPRVSKGGLLSTCAVPSRTRSAAMCCALAVTWAGLNGIGDYRALHARDQFGAAYVVNNATNVQRANIPLGKWLAAHAVKGSSVAAWDIGGLGYYSKLRIIDLYGLTDRALARLIHARASDAQKAAYVQSKRPDFIVAYAKPGRPDLQWLNASPYFRRNYRIHSYWRGGPDGYGLAVLIKCKSRTNKAPGLADG